MLDELFIALGTILSVQHMAFMLGGVVLGLAIGIFPGLGGIAGLSLLLPFLYGMDPISALAMLIGLVAVIPTSDTFTSVLMGIPGSSGSQATVLDGFPMAKKGQAARALSAAFTSSLFGGLFGAVILTGFVLVARPVILAFGSAELFMLTLLGLTMVGALAGKSLIKGLTACGLGVLLGSVGSAPATGEYRMTFDNFYLMDGLPLVVVGLGIFALPEIIDLLRQNKPIANASQLGSGWLSGIQDFFKNKWLAMRCSIIGCVVGALPGLGGSVVDWIAYGHAVQTTKKDADFGHGDVRGVIAPESSNNAKEGGGLVPTLLFGIPGSGGMAVFLGGMVLVGLEPGPAMVSTDLDITYTIVWSLAIANLFGAGACMLISPWVAKLTTIRYTLLAPFMVMVICFAAYQATRDLGDLVALLAISVLGVLMKRFDWPRPAFLIGFVLASGMETYLYQAVQFDGPAFLLRPGVMIIGAITLISLFFMIRQNSKKKAADTPKPIVSAQPSLRRPQQLFAIAVNLVFAYAVYDGFQQSFLGGIFTIVIASFMWLMSAVISYRLFTDPDHNPIYFDNEIEQGYAFDANTTSLWHYLYWLAGLIIGSYFVGYMIAITLFFCVFLVNKAGLSLWRAASMSAVASGFLLGLTHLMVLDLPVGLLQDSVSLPWPIG
ncbi:tripartite tricarboxylate transporter permease [Vibrio sp. WXL210]|uniref:tripartite tricarboxylate transporter permease n=1 Tax=Vibrio sp. WXL210 TaxID=3450709 RepID=UPI003EC94F87